MEFSTNHVNAFLKKTEKFVIPKRFNLFIRKYTEL